MKPENAGGHAEASGETPASGFGSAQCMHLERPAVPILLRTRWLNLTSRQRVAMDSVKSRLADEAIRPGML